MKRCSMCGIPKVATRDAAVLICPHCDGAGRCGCEVNFETGQGRLCRIGATTRGYAGIGPGSGQLWS